MAGLPPPSHLADGAGLWRECYRQGFRLRATGVSVHTSLVKLSVGPTCLLPPECLAASYGSAAGVQTSDLHEVKPD